MVDLNSLSDGLGVADVVDAMMMTHAHRAHVIIIASTTSATPRPSLRELRSTMSCYLLHRI